MSMKLCVRACPVCECVHVCVSRRGCVSECVCVCVCAHEYTVHVCVCVCVFVCFRAVTSSPMQMNTVGLCDETSS